MKKILSLLAAIATIFCMNAASVEWSASDLTDCANNTALDGVSAQINSNLSIAFANADATENNYIRYRSVTALPEPVIAFYSKNTITIKATDAVITSIKFNILADYTDAGNDNTPGWKFTANGITLSGETNTWTGSAEEVELEGGSKTSIIGMTIEYTPTGLEPEPGVETTYNWNATDLSDVANNELLNGRTFDINDVLSFTLADNDCDQGKEVIFKKTSSLTDINLYSRNSITFNAKEGTTIQSIKFITNTTIGTNPPTGWTLQDEAKNSYTADNDTWTGNVSEITFTCKSAAQLMGFEIVYVTTDDNSGENEDDDDGDDDQEYEEASLYFTANMVGQGAIAQDVTLSSNGTSVHFISSSTSAQIDSQNVNYGTVDDYITLEYRYRPGSRSSATTYGEFTFPCAGTLYIYAYYNNTTDPNAPGRLLQLDQNNNTIFKQTYEINDFATPENSTTKIYPVYDVKVQKGTATLLWPDNQVFLSGFTFVPDAGIGTGVETVTVNFEDLDAPAYDLFGRQVSDDYRGIYIKNGKKYIRR